MQRKSKEQNSEKIERNSVDKNIDSEQIGKFVYSKSKMFVLFLFVCIPFYWSVCNVFIVICVEFDLRRTQVSSYQELATVFTKHFDKCVF